MSDRRLIDRLAVACLVRHIRVHRIAGRPPGNRRTYPAHCWRVIVRRGVLSLLLRMDWLSVVMVSLDVRH